MSQMVKNLPAMWETQFRSLGREDPMEKGMATRSRILAWRIPWTEEPGGLPSMGSQSQTQWSYWHVRFTFQWPGDNPSAQERRFWLVPTPRACPGWGSVPWLGVEGVWFGNRAFVLCMESRQLEAAGAWHGRRLTAAPPANCSCLFPCECVNSLPSFCRMTACVAIPLLEQWARLVHCGNDWTDSRCSWILLSLHPRTSGMWGFLSGQPLPALFLWRFSKKL